MSCCGPKPCVPNGKKSETATDRDSVHASVQEYYGKVLKSSKDLKTSACTAGGRPHPLLLLLMEQLPAEVLDRFYGCGAPVPLGIQGLRVLDLGSGSGRDCYLAAALVGETGTVTGIDMTAEQLEVARRHSDEYCLGTLGYKAANMQFVQGHIELLDRAGIQDESVDIVISNCVINLSPDKPRVLQQAYRVLAPGGEMYFSDVYCDRRLPPEVKKDEVMWGECISGALYRGDFERMARAAGFEYPVVLHKAPIAINDPAMRQLLGNARFCSITYRLFKLPGLLESACEDYGQAAIYKGTIEGHENSYTLDESHTFEKGRPVLVCGNTAAMLGEDGISHLAAHFQILNDRATHFGAFGQPVSKVDEGKQVEMGASCC
ncbi:Arsenite methyltransferase [Coccomyxa sp. Obi]|nr:Arsenite methyltransferase [Coccomyxa sp. Obi]